jgi:hypothetical protein
VKSIRLMLQFVALLATISSMVTCSLLDDAGRGVGSVLDDAGRGAGSILDDAGRGAGSALGDAGRTFPSVVDDLNRAADGESRLAQLTVT